MNTLTVSLILGLAVIAAVVTLIWRAIGAGSKSSATFTIAKVFETKVEIGATEKQAATSALSRAEAERGHSPGDGGAIISALDFTRPARLLWVDDNPDGNLHETVALEKLGFFVTKTLSTDAALQYSAYMSFDLVITDKARGDDLDAGLGLIKQLRAGGKQWPIIVYTTNAAAHRMSLVNAGAMAVVDSPSELLAAITSVLSE